MDSLKHTVADCKCCITTPD